MAIIVKNTTASGISINDLAGITVGPYSEVDLREFFSLDEINYSNDLEELINNETIILNDGTRDLNKEESIEHANVYTSYEAPNYFFDLRDTPATFSGYEGMGFKVGPPGSGIQFTTLADSVPNTFVGLLDTPATYSGFAGLYPVVNNDESGIELSTINLTDLDNSLPTTSGNAFKFIRVNVDGDGWEYVDIVNSLSWAGDPTYDGDVSILGFYEKIYNVSPNSPDDPFILYSGETITSDKKVFHTHIVTDILTVSGTPFTLTVSGVAVEEDSGYYYGDSENITITGTGYYQTLKSFINEPKFNIVEESKSCTFNFYRSTYWDAGNIDFIVRGCRFEWTPDQNNWEVDVSIYHHKQDGSLSIIDNINFDENDTYIRATGDQSGKYKRTNYNTEIHGSQAEGLILTMNQRAIGHYYFELKYSIV
jgi:hypothetical protein